MRVLTFGWDYPPHTTGGLGMACFALTEALVRDDIEVIFVLPRRQPVLGSNQFIFADKSDMTVRVRYVHSSLLPYQNASTMVEVYDADGKKVLYTSSIIEQVHQYANQVARIAQEEDFDIIHAHDWTSYCAGIMAKKIKNKPLIVHTHATAYDQAGGDHADPQVYAIEKEGFETADAIIAVSNFTKDLIVRKYHISPDKVTVIHNGCDTDEPVRHRPTLTELKAQGKKLVLYHGRITIQKGVDYFIKAARKVVEYDPHVIFIISGKGDMEAQIMRQVGEMGLSEHVIFAGALWYDERDQMYQSVDLVVMPSVSEPFGLVPLEAMRHGTPALISKQSGVSEVVTHVLKVDFWDVDQMANKILAALRYPALHQQLRKEGRNEINRLSWNGVASKVRALYQHLLRMIRNRSKQ